MTFSPLWQEKTALESFIIDKTRYFKRRQKLIENLEKFLLHKASASDILTGFSGCGKSAVCNAMPSSRSIKGRKKLVI